MSLNRKTDVCFISAGEHSGDLLGADLFLALKSHNPRLQAFGIAGQAMKNAGVEPIAHIDSFSVMGFAEIAAKIPELKMLETRILRRIEQLQPKFAILIDNAAFHLRLAEQLKARGVKVIQYVAPKVWAWGKSRIANLQKDFDLILGILPFEEDFFVNNHINYKYIGNPLKDRASKVMVQRRSLGVPENKTLIACLPGSRNTEAEKILPIFFPIKDIINENNKNCIYVVPVAKNLNIKAVISKITGDRYEELILREPSDVLAFPHYYYNDVYFVEGMSLEIMAAADVGIIASGTATLECALLDTPLVVVYLMNDLTFQIAKSKVKVDFVSLVNLIAGKEVVKEFIQDFTLHEVANEVMSLLLDFGKRREMLMEFQDLRERLRGNAANQAADAIVKFLDGKVR